MIGKYKVITLCGSTRFKDAFLEAQKQLTLKGNIVISVGLFGHSGDNEVWTEGTKEMLDDMHLRKIDMADEIYVINVDGYIGSSTDSKKTVSKSVDLNVHSGDVVEHKAYGKGRVLKINADRIFVSFNGVEKMFYYPAAFEKGFLRR